MCISVTVVTKTWTQVQRLVLVCHKAGKGQGGLEVSWKAYLSCCSLNKAHFSQPNVCISGQNILPKFADSVDRYFGIKYGCCKSVMLFLRNSVSHCCSSLYVVPVADLGPCKTNRCFNGGRCEPEFRRNRTTYFCHCLYWFTGGRCEHGRLQSIS